MKTPRMMRILAAAALALAGGVAAAQAGPGAASGPGWAASGPMMGGRGMGPHAASRPGWAASGPRGMMGRGMGPRAGRDNTYGWSMMTPEERRDHVARMRSMTSYDDCRSYEAQHHQQMVERARQGGRAMPAEPRRDACAALKR